MKKDSKKHKSLIASICFAVVVGVAILAVFLIFRPKEKYSSTKSADDAMSALYCEAENPKNAFFVSGNSISPKHEVKVLFKNDAPYRISYNYYATYGNDKVAETAGALLHADYNIYMGKNNAYSEKLYPTFSINSNTLKINLYATENELDAITARFFFLGNDEVIKFESFNIDELNEIYKKQGFVCEHKEQ